MLTQNNNGLANLTIGFRISMSLLQKKLMSYRQTESDKSDEKLLRRLLSEKMPDKDAKKIINHVFSDLIKWTYEDAVFHLTQIFNFTDEESDQLIKEYDILTSATKEVIMNPPPSFEATAPRDVNDYKSNLWQARKLLLEAKKLISATALTPRDYHNQKDFEEAIVQRMELQVNFVNINKYIDDHLTFAKNYTPPGK